MKEININDLTPEQLAAIELQLKEKKTAEKAAVKKQRDDYETLKEDQVKATFEQLKCVSSALFEAKADVFNQFQTLLKMKMELYGLTPADMEIQQSHTFTAEDQKVSIILGSNVIDAWSDDVGIGLGKVMAWADNMADTPQSAKLAAYLKGLCRPDKNGVLKASRVLDMSKQANEFGDQELIEAVEFIRDQYRPVKTSTYVKAKYVDEAGVTQWLGLSMSAV